MPPILPPDFLALVPVAILTLGALVLLLAEVFSTTGRRGYQAWLTVAFAAVAGVTAAATPTAGFVFGGQAVADGFSAFITVVVCAGLAMSALVGASWLQARNAERGEFYALAMFSAAGMSLLGMATDLLVALIAIEVMSLATYALAAYIRRGKRPTEAAFKYFILGAFSSALFLYGASLVYGATGSLLFSSFRSAPGGSAIYLAGIALVVVGVAFKVAAVPFHAWTPDVYEGAPTPVTAFMAAGVKAAAFALLARVFLSAMSGGAASTALASVVTGLALLTMFFGNLLALPQNSVKRMLAYSSIAHAGYLLVGVLAASAAGAREKALSGILFYLASYTASAIGAFAVVGTIERRARLDDEPGEPWDLTRFAGLAKRRPALAFVMAVFLLSMAGVPPTAGFVAKLYVFQAAIGAELYGLAIFGILTSAMGAYYYLRVVVFMYMKPSEGTEEALSSPALSFALAAAALAVVVLGIGADPIVRLAQAASTIIM
ncbi:MAG: NADH-quinone oxidoreductase subunit N [Anaeromyxobacteraceae bacterium]